MTHCPKTKKSIVVDGLDLAKSFSRKSCVLPSVKSLDISVVSRELSDHRLSPSAKVSSFHTSGGQQPLQIIENKDLDLNLESSVSLQSAKDSNQDKSRPAETNPEQLLSGECSEPADSKQTSSRSKKRESLSETKKKEEEPPSTHLRSDSSTKKACGKLSDFNRDGPSLLKSCRARSRSLESGTNAARTSSARVKNILKPVAETLSSILRRKVKKRSDYSQDNSIRLPRSPSGKAQDRSKPRRNLDIPVTLLESSTSARAALKISSPPGELRHYLQETLSSISWKNSKSVSPRRKRSASPPASAKKKSKNSTLRFPVCKTVKVKLVSPEYVFPNAVIGPPLVKFKANPATLSGKKKAEDLSQARTKETVADLPQKSHSAGQVVKQNVPVEDYPRNVADSETKAHLPAKSSISETNKPSHSRAVKPKAQNPPKGRLRKNKRLRKNVCRHNCGLEKDGTCCVKQVLEEGESDNYSSGSAASNMSSEEDIKLETTNSHPSGPNTATVDRGCRQNNSQEVNENNVETAIQDCDEEAESSSDESDESNCEVVRGCVSEGCVTVQRHTDEDDDEGCIDLDDANDLNNFLGGPRNPVESPSDTSTSTSSSSTSESLSEHSDSENLSPANVDTNTLDEKLLPEVSPANHRAQESTHSGGEPLKFMSTGNCVCQSDEEPRLTVRQMVECLQERISTSEGRSSSTTEKGSQRSNTAQRPHKRVIKEWPPAGHDDDPGIHFVENLEILKPESAFVSLHAPSAETRPTPAPRRSTNAGETCSARAEHEPGDEAILYGESSKHLKTQVGKTEAESSSHEVQKKSSENHEHEKKEESISPDEETEKLTFRHVIGPSTVYDQAGSESFENIPLHSDGDSSQQSEQPNQDVPLRCQVVPTDESHWAEALEKAKRALKRMRSRSLSPSQVSAKLNWLVEKGKLSLNKVIKSWSNTDTTEATHSRATGVVDSSQADQLKPRVKADVSEPLPGASRVPQAASSETATQGDSLPPMYCLRINSPGLSPRRRGGSETNPHRGSSSSGSHATAKGSKNQEIFPGTSFHENNLRRVQQLPKISCEKKASSDPNRIETESDVDEKPEKATVAFSHLPICEPLPHGPLAYPTQLSSLKSKSPTLESILETDSVSESGGFNVASRPFDFEDDRSESMCVDELPHDRLDDSEKDIGENSEQEIDEGARGKTKELENSETKLDAKTAGSAHFAQASEVPTRASHSDCSRECRYDLEQMSGHDDASALSSAPLKTQSLVNTCDAVLSEPGLTDMMAILSQEVNIKRYPSYPDLTDLDNDENGEAGDAAFNLQPGGSLTAIQPMGELEVEESDICEGPRSNPQRNEINPNEDNSEGEPMPAEFEESSKMTKRQVSEQMAHSQGKELELETAEVSVDEKQKEGAGSVSPPRLPGASTSPRKLAEHHNSPQADIWEPESRVGTIVSLIESCKVLADSNSPPPILHGSCANLDALYHPTQPASEPREENCVQNEETNIATEDAEQVGKTEGSPHLLLPSPPVESPCDVSLSSESPLLSSDECSMPEKQHTTEETNIQNGERLNTASTDNSDDFRHGEPQVMKCTDSKKSSGEKTSENEKNRNCISEVTEHRECTQSAKEEREQVNEHGTSEKKVTGGEKTDQFLSMSAANQDGVDNTAPQEEHELGGTTRQAGQKEFKMPTDEQFPVNGIGARSPVKAMPDGSLITDDMLDSEGQDSSLTGIQAISGSSGLQTPDEKVPSSFNYSRHCPCGEDMDFEEHVVSTQQQRDGVQCSSIELEKQFKSMKISDSQEQFEEPDGNFDRQSLDCADCMMDFSGVEYKHQGSVLDSDVSKVNFFPNEDSGCDLSLNSQSRSHRSFSTDEDKSSGAGETLPPTCDVELKKKKKKISKHMNSGEGPSPQHSKTFKVTSASNSRAGNSSSGPTSKALSTQNSPDMNAAVASNVTSSQLPKAPRATLPLGKTSGGGGARHGRKEIKWDDEISFGEEEGMSTQSSSEMSSNRCNSCTSERSKAKGDSCGQKKRSNSLCKSGVGTNSGERSRARRAGKRDKPYKSQVRRSPPPPGMTRFNPRECLAKGETNCVRKTSAPFRVSRSLTSHVTTQAPARSRSAHGDGICHESALKGQPDQGILVPGGDVGCFIHGKNPRVFGRAECVQGQDPHIKVTEFKEGKTASKSTDGKNNSVYVNANSKDRKGTDSVDGSQYSCGHSSKAVGSMESKELNNNHSFNPACLEYNNNFSTPKLTPFSAERLRPYDTASGFNTGLLNMGSLETFYKASSPLASGIVHQTNWQQQQQQQQQQQRPDSLLSGFPYNSSSTGDLRYLTHNSTDQAVRSRQEQFVSRLARRVHSTDLNLARAYNFVSRSQLHLDRCDQLIQRSSDIIQRSEEILATSRSQIESTAKSLCWASKK